MTRPTLIFLHVPKTGGSTVHRVMRRQYRADRIYWMPVPREGGTAQFRALPTGQRARYHAISGHMRFGLHEHVPRPCTYFAMLRDPVERAISAYRYVIRTPSHRLHDVIAGGGLTLDAVLRRGLMVELDDLQVRMLSGLEEAEEARAGAGDALDRARENVEAHFGLLGLTERFDETLVLARRRFGWSGIFYRPRNVARDRLPAETVPATTIELIREQSRLDQELYDWAAARFDAEVREAGKGFAREVEIFRRANPLLGHTGLAHRVFRFGSRVRGLAARVVRS